MAKRTDKNQAEIVSNLRAIGLSVFSLHTVGHGCPDLLVGGFAPCPNCGTRIRQNKLLEVKTEHGTLTTAQQDFHLKWKGDSHVVRTVQEALALFISARPVKRLE